MLLKRKLCSTKQYRTPRYITNYSLPFQVYKRTSMDLRSFLEHKWKWPNRGENKVIIVHQGGFFYLRWRALVWCMSSTRIYHSLAPTWTKVTLRYQDAFFNKSLFEVLESLWWNRTPTNTSVKLMGLRSGLTAGHSIS